MRIYLLSRLAFYSAFIRGIIDVADQQVLGALAEKVLGPMNLRSAERPTKLTRGTYEGGVAFERSPRASGIKGARCYATAHSHQVAPNIASTTAGSKQREGDQENLQLRTEVNTVRLFHPLSSSRPSIHPRIGYPHHRCPLLSEDGAQGLLRNAGAIWRYVEYPERR